MKQAIWLLGKYLEEQSYTQYNPANSSSEFENETFGFYFEPENKISYFSYHEKYNASWYIWVERNFEESAELTAQESINMLIQCIASLTQDSPEVQYDNIKWDSVVLDWVPVDDEDSRRD